MEPPFSLRYQYHRLPCVILRKSHLPKTRLHEVYHPLLVGNFCWRLPPSIIPTHPRPANYCHRPFRRSFCVAAASPFSFFLASAIHPLI